MSSTLIPFTSSYERGSVLNVMMECDKAFYRISALSYLCPINSLLDALLLTLHSINPSLGAFISSYDLALEFSLHFNSTLKLSFNQDDHGCSHFPFSRTSPGGSRQSWCRCCILPPERTESRGESLFRFYDFLPILADQIF